MVARDRKGSGQWRQTLADSTIPATAATHDGIASQRLMSNPKKAASLWGKILAKPARRENNPVREKQP
jgi:hypothetical protein